MSGTFTYDFQELPLLIDNHFKAGLIDGSADIWWHDDAEWGVSAIHLEGYKAGSPVAPVEVPYRGGTQLEYQLYLTILDRLEDRRGAFHGAIEARVQEEIDEARAGDPDYARDMQRERAWI